MATLFEDVQKQTMKENEIILSRSDEHNHPQNEAEIVVSTVPHAFGHILHE